MTDYPENDNKNIIRALNVLAWILVISGIIATAVLLAKFGREGMYTEAKLELPEVMTSLVAGFYHWLMASLCFAVGRILNPPKGADPSRTIGFLRFFGWGAILIGIIGAFLIFPKGLGMGPMTLYRIPGAFAFAIYSAAFGFPCIGIAALLRKN